MDNGFDTVSSFADAPDELLKDLGLSSIHRRLFRFGQKTIQVARTHMNYCHALFQTPHP